MVQDQNTNTSYGHHELPQLSSASLEMEALPIPSSRRPPAMQLPSRLRLHLPIADDEPPTSPAATDSVLDPSASKFAPLLTRASSVLSRRQSVSPRRRSPVREGQESLLHSPIPEDGQASSASVSSPSHAQRASKAATTFVELFQGSSELVSGFSMSPTKRRDSTYTTRQRPSHSRANSAMTAAASFFGRASPTKHFRDQSVEEDYEMLELDVDNELFPKGVPMDIGLPDFDDLKGNAERLFMRMQITYQNTVDNLQIQRVTSQALQQELEGTEARAAHLKSQLHTISREQDQRVRQLEMELEHERQLRQTEAERRVRSIRPVGKPTLAVPGDDGHRLFSGAREDGLYSLSEAGFDSGDESEGGSSNGSRCWSPPDSPDFGSRSPSPARPGWPGLGAANLMEENLRLKARVAELEETVDGCLGLVGEL